jgi:ADP-heptose:LPS heptosyltransferase
LNFIIIKNDGIGDIILFSGLLTSIATQNGVAVDLVTRKENAPIANRIPGLRKIFFAERDHVDDETIHEINGKNQYDVAIVPRRFIRKNVFKIMQNVSAKKKFCCWQYPTNLTHEEAQNASKDWKLMRGSETLIPELLYLQRFCQHALSCSLDPTPRLDISDLTSSKSSTESKNQIGICLSGASSRWSFLHWLHLLEGIVEEGLQPVLFGSKHDLTFANRLCKKVKSIKSFVGQLNLEQTISEFSKLPCVIANDTGLAHAASLCPTKVLIILGGGTFHRFFPWPKKDNQFVIHHGMECYDCEWRCHHNENLCLDFIGPDSVLKYLLQILRNENVPHVLDLNNEAKNYPIAWRLSTGICPEASTQPKQIEENTSFTESNDGLAITVDTKAKKIIIFGTGPTAKKMIDDKIDQKELICTIDNDPQKINGVFAGKPIRAPEEILTIEFDEILLASGQPIEMYHQLRDLGVDSEKIVFPYHSPIS